MDKAYVKDILAPTYGSVSSIGSIRLNDAMGNVQLISSTTLPNKKGVFQYKTELSSAPVESHMNKTKLFELPQLLPPPPKWDISSYKKGLLSLVYELAGGALNSLALRRMKHSEFIVTEKHPLNSFSRPRFVKRYKSGGDAPITAVCDNKDLVVFQVSETGRFGGYKKICECEDGIILRHGEGYELFYKVTTHGPVRGNDISRGVLHHARLRKDFTMVGQPVQLIGNEPIFEFDIDSIRDNVAIFATLESEVVLLLKYPETNCFSIISTTNEYDETMLSNPAVLVTEDRLHFAILESADTKNARLLTGAYSVSDLMKKIK